MFLRKFLTADLLLFVGVSLVVLGIDLCQDSSFDDLPELDGRPGPALRVYFFHGARCPTCEAIDAYTREVLATRYADELARGEIAWRDVDYNDPRNELLLRRFQVFGVMVVLADGRAWPPARWKNLEDVWAYTSDRAAFLAYVEKEVGRFLQEGR